MLLLLLNSLYLATPAFVANMMPVILARLHVLVFLDKPIDNGFLWRGKRLLGNNKTWRGVIGAMIGALLVVFIQYYLKIPLGIMTFAYDSLLIALVYGISIGALVMAGDAIGSIIKRQLGLRSGDPSIPLDQIDYIVLFIIGTIPFTQWTIWSACILTVATFFLNIGTNVLAYVTGIKKTYW